MGYCDRSPAILINKEVYGPLTPEKLEEILENLRTQG
ncbi:MAG: NAD(P)H-dependent oxidoreductase subunit E [Syntrophobacteria bacterium]